MINCQLKRFLHAHNLHLRFFSALQVAIFFFSSVNEHKKKKKKFFTLIFMLFLAPRNTSLFENRSHMNFLLVSAETMWKTEVPLAQAKWLKSQN